MFEQVVDGMEQLCLSRNSVRDQLQNRFDDCRN